MSGAVVTQEETNRSRAIYRMVWRWHFYAGIFCIPLVIWLACTGSIYLFKPQIDRWLDRPYDRLSLAGPRATPEQIANAAMDAVPNSSLHYYELPTSPENAVRVIVGVGRQEYRVYVHPVTRQVLHVLSEDERPTRILSRLHGELLAGDWGSRVVELAASWAIVLIVSGLYLWWPRQSEKFAGVFRVRFTQGQRIFWRDLHAVTGFWISALALFLLLTGLPWAKSWGAYFKKVREVTGTAVLRQDWSSGRSSELADREAMNRNSLAASAIDHAAHMGHTMPRIRWGEGYAPLNTIVPAAQQLGLAYPVLIMPAMNTNGAWTVKSDAQNRPLRTTVTMDPHSGAIVTREDFSQRHLVDRVLGFGIAAHEGQLFGLFNQLLGLITAIGLILLSVSASVLWWRRRHVGVLGAPVPIGRPRPTAPLVLTILALALYLPAMAGSLVVVILLEKLLLSRIAPVSRWLGLAPA